MESFCFDPVDLVLDQSDSFIVVEQTHLVGFGLFLQKIRLLNVGNSVRGYESLLIDYFKAEVHRRQ